MNFPLKSLQFIFKMDKIEFQIEEKWEERISKIFFFRKMEIHFAEIFQLRLMLCLWDETKVHCGLICSYIYTNSRERKET